MSDVSPLARQGAAAAALVAIVALAFWGIGSLTADGGGPVVAGDPERPAVDEKSEPPADDAADPPADLPPEDGETPPEGEAESPPADDGDRAPAEDGDEGDDDDGPDPDEGAAGSEDDGGDGSSDGSSDGEDPGGQTGPAIDPGSVSVQVLDGFKADGGAAAAEAADLLESEGYDIVAENDALDYDVTTVLFNPGNEEAAQQIAAELGAGAVREQPGTLSSEVDLHVVVGSDRG